MDQETLEKASNVWRDKNLAISLLEDCVKVISKIEERQKEDPLFMANITILDFNVDITADFAKGIILDQKEKYEARIIELEKAFKEL